MSSFRLALLTAALALAQGTASAVTLDGVATPGSTVLGSTATVNLALSLSDPVTLFGTTLNVDWDPAVLSLDSATVFGMSMASFIALFDTDPLLSDVNIEPGHIGLNLLAGAVMPNLPAGPASMSFSFTGLAEGVQSVSVALSLTTDAFEDVPLALDTTVTVTPVPEPTPALLLASGLAVLGLLARRRRPA